MNNKYVSIAAILLIIFFAIIIFVIIVAYGSSPAPPDPPKDEDSEITVAHDPPKSGGSSKRDPYYLYTYNGERVKVYLTIINSYLVFTYHRPSAPSFSGENGEVLLYNGAPLYYSTLEGEIRNGSHNNNGPVKVMYNSVGDYWSIAVSLCVAMVGTGLTEDRRVQMFQVESVTYCKGNAPNYWSWIICGGEFGKGKNPVYPFYLFREIVS